jgi:hypothetical protein
MAIRGPLGPRPGPGYTHIRLLLLMLAIVALFVLAR